MLATAGEPPSGPDWLHEVKWDGMRVLVDVSDDGVRLWSRSGRDVTVSFPELLDIADTIPDGLLDGEIIVLRDGVPSFEALADRMHVADAKRARALAADKPVTVMVFDLLRLYGVDLTRRPLDERRASLEKLDLPADHWRHSPCYDDGPALFRATLEQGLEGVIAKRRRSTYQVGRRSADWIKTPHRRVQACVVGAWRPEQNSAAEKVGSLLVGVPDDDGALAYAGRVGSGISYAASQDLKRLLARLVRPTAPFVGEVPALDRAGATWVQPEVVIEVRFSDWTTAGRLRHPVFRGIRTDLGADEVRRES